MRYPRSPAAQGRPAESLIVFVPDRPGHDRRYATDGRRIEDELGFRPEASLDRGLRQTLAWYLENEPWWRGVRDGSYASRRSEAARGDYLP